jgi:hypothetical protein
MVVAGAILEGKNSSYQMENTVFCFVYFNIYVSLLGTNEQADLLLSMSKLG